MSPDDPTRDPLSALRASLAGVLAEASAAAISIDRLADLPAERARFLGKRGAFSAFMRTLGGHSGEARPAAGALINECKAAVEASFAESVARLEADALASELASERVDITLPGRRAGGGTLHPVQQVLDELVDLLTDLGFDIADGPEVETERYNFDLLNMPADHPARDMQDTFYLENDLVLRTQTSPVQIRVMEAGEPPFRVIAPGKVYRCDADVTHSPTFHQIEGLWIDRDVTMMDLKSVLTAFLQRLFGSERAVRFRPSFFPFTEPSVEVDVGRADGGWMEVLGAGMVHPQVLRNVGLDPAEWQGFAFGIGVDRLAMLRFGVTDIRYLFENDLRFLRQF